MGIFNKMPSLKHSEEVKASEGLNTEGNRLFGRNQNKKESRREEPLFTKGDFHHQEMHKDILGGRTEMSNWFVKLHRPALLPSPIQRRRK